jgi:hypothetical protein
MGPQPENSQQTTQKKRKACTRSYQHAPQTQKTQGLLHPACTNSQQGYGVPQQQQPTPLTRRTLPGQQQLKASAQPLQNQERLSMALADVLRDQKP